MPTWPDCREAREEKAPIRCFEMRIFEFCARVTKTAHETKHQPVEQKKQLLPTNQNMQTTSRSSLLGGCHRLILPYAKCVVVAVMLPGHGTLSAIDTVCFLIT